MNPSGLTQEVIDSIRLVCSKYEQVESAVIFGSRAMGSHNPASDIDLALKGKKIDLSLQTRIEFDLDDLMLPCKFDVSVYEKISNTDLIDHINRAGKEIYSKTQHGSGLSKPDGE